MSAVYLITTKTQQRIVQAGSKSTAINHVVKSEIECRAITASELVELLGFGLVVETASTPKDAPTDPDFSIQRAVLEAILEAEAGTPVTEMFEVEKPVAEIENEA